MLAGWVPPGIGMEGQPAYAGTVQNGGEQAAVPAGSEAAADTVTSSIYSPGASLIPVGGAQGIPETGSMGPVGTAAASSAPTMLLPDTEPPSAPTDLQAVEVTDHSVTLTWEASVDLAGVVSYEVERDGVSAGTVTGTTYRYQLTGLSARTVYVFTVKAADAAGNVSMPSSPLSITTKPGVDTEAPSVPTGLAVAGQSESSISLGWTASTDNVGVTGYEVYRDETYAATVTETTYQANGLSPGVAYSFKARALDAAGNRSAFSTTICASTLADKTPPTVPGNLTVTGKTDTTVSLSWTASTDNVGVSGYEIYNGAAVVASVSDATSTTITGLAPYTSYTFSVKAKDAAGNVSGASGSVGVTTDMKLLTPFQSEIGVIGSNKELYYQVELTAYRTYRLSVIGETSNYSGDIQVYGKSPNGELLAQGTNDINLYVPTSNKYFVRLIGTPGTKVVLVLTDGTAMDKAYPMESRGSWWRKDIRLPANEEGYYQIQLTAERNYIFSAAGSTGVTVYDGNKKAIGSSATSKISFTADQSGTYYIQIQGGNTTRDYTAYLSEEIRIPGPSKSTISGSSSWYSLELTANRTVQIKADVGSSQRRVEIYSGSLGSGSQVAQGTNGVAFTAPTSGTYYVVIFGSNGEAVTWSAWDGSSFEKAYTLNRQPGNVRTATNSIPANDSAYYKVALEAGKEYTFAESTGQGIALYAPDGTYIGRSTAITLSYPITTSGEYYLRVFGPEQPASVAFTVFEQLKSDGGKQESTLSTDGYNWYATFLVREGSFSLTVDGASSFGIYNAYNGTAVATPSSGKNTVTFKPTASGHYYIRVNGPAGGKITLTSHGSISGTVSAIQLGKLDPKEVDWQSLLADPIDTSTGAHVIHHTFLAQQSSQPFALNLSYNSLLLAEGPLGRGWSHEFETRVEPQPDGSLQLKWNANRQNTFWLTGTNTYTSSQAAVKRDILVRNPDGTFTLQRNDQSVYTFDAAGRLLSQVDGRRQGFDLAYNPDGTLQRVSQRITGQYLDFAYTNGFLNRVTDSLGRQVSFTFDGAKNLIQLSVAGGKTIVYTYNADGRVMSGTDNEGNRLFRNTYDSQGRVIRQLDALDQVSILEYDEAVQPGKLITTVTNREGKVRKLIHDSQYRLVQIIDEVGGTTSYTYDADGNRTSSTDAAGGTQRMTYDAKGNLLQVTDATGGSTVMTYDERRNLLTVTDSAGHTVTNMYDSANNLIRTTDADGKTTELTYDSQGLLIAKTTADGAVIRYGYESGQLTAMTDPLGNVTRYAYDGAGRLVRITDPLGATLTNTYDDQGNLIRVTDTLGGATTMTYSKIGDLLSRTDALGHTTTYSYNANGKRTTATDSQGNITRYAYDAEDRLIAVTDALGNVTTTLYDAKGRLSQTIDPQGNVTTLSYDPADHLVRQTDPEGKFVTYAYDAAGRVTQKTDRLGGITKLGYDSTGRLILGTDPLGGKTTLSYDANENVLMETDPLGAGTTYTYGSNGKLETATDANGHVIRYAYDKNGRPITITNAANGTTRNTYDAAGHLIQVEDANGDMTRYSYDAKGRLIKTRAPNGSIIRQTYDAMDRITSKTDGEGHTETYTYDAFGHLTASTDAAGKTTNMTYDAVGHLLTRTDPLGYTVRYS
ncbi:fibronectin type III domain-containing protein [Gorillibacterium sp. sgz5001074]|uniref:fibronectin type III domain-containing protein n=2 Tax=Gorillibacterium sp. sgz5001074 TaxID=3446695 RepID=UPI003F669949